MRSRQIPSISPRAKVCINEEVQYDLRDEALRILPTSVSTEDISFQTRSR